MVVIYLDVKISYMRTLQLGVVTLVLDTRDTDVAYHG